MKRPQANWALKISTLLVVTACFVVVGSGLLVSQNFKNIVTLWGEDIQMTVYLTQDISDSGIEFISNKIKESSKVDEVQFITKEKALEEFRGRLASYAPDLTQDQDLLSLVPSSLQVRFVKSFAVGEQMRVMQSLATDIKKYEGVEDVAYGEDWIEKYSALVLALESTFTLLGFVILAATAMVISNSIRASLESHKDEILVLEMIGATSSMIRKPFITEGALLGTCAAVIATLTCFGLYSSVKNIFSTKLSYLQIGQSLQFFSPAATISFIVAGCFVGSLASYFCVRSMNNGFSGRQGST